MLRISCARYFFFVVLHPFVDVLFSVPEHAVDESGQHVGHGGDGFGCAETCSQAAELGSQVSLAAPQSGGGHAQGGGGTVLDMSGAPAEHLAPGNLVVRTQAQEGSKWASLGKRLISIPTSAMMVCAFMMLMPSI